MMKLFLPVIARSASDEAIQKPHCRLDCFAALAMTAFPDHFIGSMRAIHGTAAS